MNNRIVVPLLRAKGGEEKPQVGLVAEDGRQALLPLEDSGFS